MFQKTNAESNESTSKESNFIILKVHSKPDSERNWSGSRWFDILSIDPAVDNIGFRIERRFHNGKVVKLFYEKVDAGIEDNADNKNIDIFKLMGRVYELKPLIEKCHICVFESQFAYYNVECQWFIIGVIGTIVRDNPLLTIMIAVNSRLKSRMLGCPKDYNRNAIKKWGIVKAIEFCIRSRDFESISIILDETKRDDITDALIQIVVALKILCLPEPVEFPIDLTPVTAQFKALFDTKDSANRRKQLTQMKAYCYQLIQQYPLEIPEDAMRELGIIEQFRQRLLPPPQQTIPHTGLGPVLQTHPQTQQQEVPQQVPQMVMVQQAVQNMIQTHSSIQITQPNPTYQTVPVINPPKIGVPIVQQNIVQQPTTQQTVIGAPIGQPISQPSQATPGLRVVIPGQPIQTCQSTPIQPGVKIQLPGQPIQQPTRQPTLNPVVPEVRQQDQARDQPQLSGLVINFNHQAQQSSQQVSHPSTPTIGSRIQDQKIDYNSDSDDENEGSLSPTEIQKRLERYQKMRQKPERNPFLEADKEIKSVSIEGESFALQVASKIKPVSHGILGEIILPDPSLFRSLEDPSPVHPKQQTDQTSKLVITMKPPTVHPKLVDAGVPASQKFDSGEVISAVVTTPSPQTSHRSSSELTSSSSSIETEISFLEPPPGVPLFPSGKRFEPPRPKDGVKYTINYPLGVVINKSRWILIPY